LEFIPVTKREVSYSKVRALYKKAFPKKEQVPLWMLFRNVKSRNASFNALYDNGKWVGLIYTIEHNNIVMVVYLAIDETCRSGGYGSKVLTSLKEKHPGKRIVLEIEKVDDRANNYEQRLKRKNFYKKNGYQSTGYITTLLGEKFEVMFIGGSISKVDLKGLYRILMGGFLSFFFAPKFEDL
jgi:hypothetical protein